MSKTIELDDGDTAVVIRHDKDAGDQYALQIFHFFEETLDDETKLFYHVMARGMCALAAKDPEKLFEHAGEADINSPDDDDEGKSNDTEGMTHGNA